MLKVHTPKVFLQLKIDSEASRAVLARKSEGLVVGLVVQIVLLAREFLITVLAGETFLLMHASMSSEGDQVAE